MAPTSGEIERELIRERNEITIDDFTICYYCKSTGLKETDIFCPNCGFPQRGTQNEMRKFLVNVNNKRKLLLEQRKSINKARNILYFLAGFYIVVGVIVGLMKDDFAILISAILGAGIYFALAFWSRTHPFPAILSGFFVYVVFNVVAAITDPHTIYQGLLLKIFIISGFIYGYKGAKDSKNLEVELESIKKAKDLGTEN